MLHSPCRFRLPPARRAYHITHWKYSTYAICCANFMPFVPGTAWDCNRITGKALQQRMSFRPLRGLRRAGGDGTVQEAWGRGVRSAGGEAGRSRRQHSGLRWRARHAGQVPFRVSPSVWVPLCAGVGACQGSGAWGGRLCETRLGFGGDLGEPHAPWRCGRSGPCGYGSPVSLSMESIPSILPPPSGLGEGGRAWSRRLTPPATFCRRFAATPPCGRVPLRTVRSPRGIRRPA